MVVFFFFKDLDWHYFLLVRAFCRILICLFTEFTMDYPVDSIPAGSLEFVYTTHVTSQELFYVHLETHGQIVDTITEKLEKRYTNIAEHDKLLKSMRLGSLCAARFNDDETWYRAKITGACVVVFLCVFFG